jgi:hypothetical protein
MTGQVKEDIITRFGEIGLKVKGGQIVYLDQSGSPKSKLIQSGDLAVTFCHTLLCFD